MPELRAKASGRLGRTDGRRRSPTRAVRPARLHHSEDAAQGTPLREEAVRRALPRGIRCDPKFFEAQFPVLERAVPAMVAEPESFGSLVNFLPHVNGVASLGVFTRDGVFHPLPDDLDFTVLEELFRDAVFRAFLKCEVITEDRIELLRSWRHSGFHLEASWCVAEGDRFELESGTPVHRPSASVAEAP